MIRLHSYHGTQNLGDAIQSLALLRLCKELRPDLEYGWVDRDGWHDIGMEPVLANGWLGHDWCSQPNSIACGIHLSTPEIASRLGCYRADSDIGARDPATHDMLSKLVFPSEMIGCATLTLPRYEGGRMGSWKVDSDFPPIHVPSYTHLIPDWLPWEDQMTVAERSLSVYQTSREIFTSRLHVLLPCIAFGTPVALTHIPPNEERRFSLAKYLGVEVGNEPKLYDASELAAKFRAFTLSALNRLSPP